MIQALKRPERGRGSTEPSNSNITDIEAYRKKRKKKRLMKRLIAALVIFILLGATVLIGYFVLRDGDGSSFDDSQSGAAGDNGIRANGYPISLGGTNPLDIIDCGKSVFLLTKNSLTAFNNAGKQLYTVNHGYSNPVLAASDKRVLTYDQGGYQFRVDTNKSVMGSKKLSEKITCAAVANNGYVAVATQTERYAINLTVYDNDMKEILSWSASDRIITAIDFNEKSSECMIAAYSVTNGSASASIIALELKKSEPVRFEKSLAGGLPLSIDYKGNDQIGVVTDKKSYILDSKGEVKSEYEYNGQLVSFSNRSGHSIALLVNAVGDAEQVDMAVLGSDGTVKTGSDVGSSVTDVQTDGTHYFVLADNKLKTYDSSLKLIQSADTNVNAMRIACFGGDSYLLEAGALQKIPVS